MRTIGHRRQTLLLSAVLLAAAPAAAQGTTGATTDGSEAVVGADTAAAVFALVGRGMRDPAAARYSHLRRGRAGAVCGEVDATNRMGVHTGPRPFVADAAAGFGAILPDAPELRNPSSPTQYRAMQRTLELHRTNCTAG